MQDGLLRRPGHRGARAWTDAVPSAALGRAARARASDCPGLRSAIRVLLGVAVLSAPPIATAEPQTVACPLRVVTQAALVAELDKLGAFKVAFHGNSLAFLTGVAVYDGPPAAGSELPPAPAGNGMLQWTFPGAKSPPVLVCRYEGGVSLTRALSPGMRACVASMQRSTARDSLGVGLEFAVFACQ